MRRRPARWRSTVSSMRGSATSHSSATMTIAVALRARTTLRPSALAAAGRAREEDHAVRVARDLVEAADHLGLTAPAGCGGRHRGPHALVELAAECPDQPLLVLAHLHVALVEQHLTVAG